MIGREEMGVVDEEGNDLPGIPRWKRYPNWPIGFDPDLFQQHPDMVDPFTTPEVALVVMAGALQAADAVSTVGPFLDGPEHVNDIDFAGAGNPDNINIGGIIELHVTCQVRGGISSIVATKRNNRWFKALHYCSSTSNASILLII